jgi:flagellar assembly factor FliW
MNMMSALAETRPLVTDFQVQSDLLGAFTVRTDAVIEFPNGLLGFPECRRFALVRAGTDTVYWLQSLDYTALCFLLVDPFPYFSDYAVEIPPAEVFELGGVNATDIALLAIITLPAPGASEKPTANLQGPVIVNLRSRRGKQLICTDVDHGVRRPLTLRSL